MMVGGASSLLHAANAELSRGLWGATPLFAARAVVDHLGPYGAIYRAQVPPHLQPGYLVGVYWQERVRGLIESPLRLANAACLYSEALRAGVSGTQGR